MLDKSAAQGKPTINQVISKDRRKLHYLYPDNSEMVEEFDLNSNECIIRKIKKPKEFGTAEWEYEIGMGESNFNPEKDLLAPSN